jgi:hypothetical protein
MIRWRATGKIVKANGEKTVFYRGDGTDYRIESRTRWIQNNKNNGRRLFTTYMVLKWPDEEVAEKYSLADAKSFVEGLMKGDRDGTD